MGGGYGLREVQRRDGELALVSRPAECAIGPERRARLCCAGAVGLPASTPAKTLADGTKVPAVEGVRFHDLRHTFATLQLSAGTHFMQVSKWWGHSTFTLTLDTYGDYIPEQDGGALNTLPEPTASAAPAALPSNVINLFGRQSS